MGWGGVGEGKVMKFVGGGKIQENEKGGCRKKLSKRLLDFFFLHALSRSNGK